jgi:hypothetical protein
MKPYNQLEKRYLVEQRIQEQIEEHGSIENAITYCRSILNQCEDIWSDCSYECVGHAITCNRMLISRLEEQLAIQLDS